MRKSIFMFALSLLAATVSAQSDSVYISLSKGRVAKFSVDEVYSMGFTPVEAPQYPAPDASQALVYSPGWDSNKTKLAKNAHDLLVKAGVECTDTMGRVVITDEQYEEIKVFTDELVKGLSAQKAIYDKCFRWVAGNIKYAFTYSDGSPVDNNAYPVFKTKMGICQGYANLLHVMLHSQGVPVLVTNGFIPEGGHAWNYVNCDGTWYVSDPTNWRDIAMSRYSEYSSTFMPVSMDVALFKEDGLWFNYVESRLNLCQVHGDDVVVVVPYSVQGFKISLFNPDYVSPSVRELYVGENIESFADVSSGYPVGLKTKAPNLEYIHVSPNNKYFTSYEGAVYNKSDNTIAVVPAAMKCLKLMPLELLDKGAVEYADGIEEIYIAEGTKKVEAYAISDCPKLKIAYIPADTEVSSAAFYNVHKKFKIVRY